MKYLCVFVILFVFSFNELSASVIPENNETAIEISPHYNISKSTDCMDKFKPVFQSLLLDIRNKSISCVETAENQIQLEMTSVDEYPVKFLQQLNSTQITLNNCTRKAHAHAFKYVECMKNFAAINREMLQEMDLTTERFYNRITEIENNMKICANKSMVNNELKSTSAFSYLRKCLLSHKPPLSSELQDNREISYYLNKTRIFYSECRTYNDEYDDFEDCLESALSQMDLLNIKDVLTDRSAEYFSKLVEIDEEENTCLRHFITKHMFSDFDFDLESCIRDGFISISTQNSDNYSLREGLKNIMGSMISCKLYQTSSGSVNCILNKLVIIRDSDFEQKLNLKSEQELTDFNRNELLFAFDNACMKYFWRKLQFRGLGMDANAKTNLENCLYKFYT